jgi:hypothetical protein
MKIVNTFVEGLWSLKYEGEKFYELEKLIEQWTDYEYLLNFYTENEKDLYYFNLTVEEAVEITISETNNLIIFLDKLVSKNIKTLDSVFKPLDDLEFRVIELSKQKAKRRWLRLYAIKIETNNYVITGGAIKLSLKMQERENTKQELMKLNMCKNYLQAENVFDLESFYDLIF